MADPILPPPVKSKDLRGPSGDKVWDETLWYPAPSQAGLARRKGLEPADTDEAKQKDAALEMAEASVKQQKASKQRNPGDGPAYWQSEVQKSAEDDMRLRRKMKSSYGNYPRTQ